MYVSHVLWDKHGTIACAALIEEWRINGDKSIVAHADRLAVEYGLDKVSEVQANKKLVKRVIKQTNDLELWTDCFASNAVISRPDIKVSNGDKAYFSWPKTKSRSLLFWRIGALRLKTQWKIYNTKRGLGTDCVMPLCNGVDNIEHIKKCTWYDTKWSDKVVTDSDFANYLVKINRERLNKVKMPIL